MKQPQLRTHARELLRKRCRGDVEPAVVQKLLEPKAGVESAGRRGGRIAAADFLLLLLLLLLLDGKRNLAVRHGVDLQVYYVRTEEGEAKAGGVWRRGPSSEGYKLIDFFKRRRTHPNDANGFCPPWQSLR